MVTVILTHDEYAHDISRGGQLWHIVGIVSERSWIRTQQPTRGQKQSAGITIQTFVNGNFPYEWRSTGSSTIGLLQRGCIVDKKRRREGEEERVKQRGNWMAFNKGTRAKFLVHLPPFALRPRFPHNNFSFNPT